MTDRSMILRIAIAMSDADPIWGREVADRWERKSKHQRQRYIGMAIAAMKAMREPTATMIQNVPVRPIWRDDAHAWYRYMIDAELAEDKNSIRQRRAN